MTRRARRIWPSCVAVAAALAIAGGGCTVSLRSGVSRARGYAGGIDVSRASAGSRDDVPVHGHRVAVGRRGGAIISGELIAAAEDEVVVDSPGYGWLRIPMDEISFITIELAPGQAGPVAVTSLAAIGVGVAGLGTLKESSSISAFFAGWGLVWVPLGLLVALPTAGVIAANGDSTLDSREWGRAALAPHLYEFARFPQGDPGRAAKRPATGSATAPPVTPPPVTAPPVTPPAVHAPSPPVTAPGSAAPGSSPETTSSIAPPPPPKPKPAPAPAPAAPEDPDEPTVEPYSPERAPPAR